MPVSGPKPKPRDQIRHRVPPRHDWIEVDNVPFADPPRLPAAPHRAKVPAPARTLGPPGAAFWEQTWAASAAPLDADRLLVLCEQLDERQVLRDVVLAPDAVVDWRERVALRQLDTQVTSGLAALHRQLREGPPGSWPAATRRWWRGVSSMPHCALWTETDWQFALDTAVLVAAFHAGNHRVAGEVRRRESMMGTTVDARRDLRIRYLEPDGAISDGVSSSVTAMAEYRRSVGG
jgi:hypothetical protein